MPNHSLKARQQAAFDALRECAQVIETRSSGLLAAVASWEMDGGPRRSITDLCTAATDTSRRVLFELALLQQQLADGQETAASVLQRLTQLEATIMSGLSGFADVVDELETEAERDERIEPAFTGSIETLGEMMRVFQQAKTATENLRAASR
jgi:hypothetical protein